MHTIGFVVFPNFYLLGFAAVTAFELANAVLGEPAYGVTVLSEQGGLVLSSAGVRVETQAFGDAAFDTVMFSSGVEIDTKSAALTEPLSMVFTAVLLLRGAMAMAWPSSTETPPFQDGTASKKPKIMMAVSSDESPRDIVADSV